jgi:integrase
MRVLKESVLQTRTARQRLPQRHLPYYRSVGPGAHLGYRKGETTATWLARAFLGHGRYVSKRIGPADDRPDMPGALDYSTAATKAREWCAAQILQARTPDEPIPAGPYTVRQATDDYLADYKLRGGRGLRTVEAIIRNHILPSLGAIEVADLTTRRLRQWHQHIAQSAPRKRTAKLASKINRGVVPATPDEIRARQSTANGARAILVAALNFAFREGRVASDATWRRTKPFKGVDSARIAYLSADEVKRLVNGSAPDLRNMIRAAILTGCRYAELAALIVSDFNPDAGTVLIQRSKSGKPRHVYLTEEGKAFFAAATVGKVSNDLIFRKANSEPWRATNQHRPMRAACKAAKIKPPVGFHALRHTHASLMAMQGAPLTVIAQQLGHSDTRITEKHYQHLSPSFVGDTVRSSLPVLDILDKSNIAPMQRQRAGK